MRIQEALYHEFSPGQVFMLDENAMIEAIQLLSASPKWHGKYGFSESAGVALVRCEMEEKEAWDLLNDYYMGTTDPWLDLKLISDYIDIVPGFLRSTNLSNDWKKTKSKSDYIITPNVSQSLDRVYNGLIMEDGQQAFTLIGPYGSGKSAFAVFLCRLMGIDPVLSGKAMDLLSKADTSENFTKEQIRTVKKKKQGFLPIVITARRRPISQLLLEGILNAVHLLEDGPGISQLISRIQEALDKNYWEDSDTVLNFLFGDPKRSKGSGTYRFIHLH